MSIKTVADLKKELHKNGIKTYRNKKNGKSYIAKADAKKVLAGGGAGVTLEFTGGSADYEVKDGKVIFDPAKADVRFESYMDSQEAKEGFNVQLDTLEGDDAEELMYRFGDEGGSVSLSGDVYDGEDDRQRKLVLSGGYVRSKYEAGDSVQIKLLVDSDYNVWVSGTATFTDEGEIAYADLDEPDDEE